MKLEHYSSHPNLMTTGIDPVFHGKGVAGAESKRKVEPQWVDRSYHYVVGTAPERMVGAKPYIYETEVPDEKIYDMSADPLKLRAKSMWGQSLDRNAYESHIKAAGYHGFRNPKDPDPTMANVVALFHPVKPHSVRTSDSLEKSIDLHKARGRKELLPRREMTHDPKAPSLHNDPDLGVHKEFQGWKYQPSSMGYYRYRAPGAKKIMFIQAQDWPDFHEKVFMKKSEPMEKELSFEGTEQEPHRMVWRVEHKHTGSGPYDDPNWRMKPHDTTTGHPGPWVDPGFNTQDRDELDYNHNHVLFGFENEDQVNKWFHDPVEREKLLARGFVTKQIPAKRIWRSGKQLFFEPHGTHPRLPGHEPHRSDMDVKTKQVATNKMAKTDEWFSRRGPRLQKGLTVPEKTNVHVHGYPNLEMSKSLTPAHDHPDLPKIMNGNRQLSSKQLKIIRDAVAESGKILARPDTDAEVNNYHHDFLDHAKDRVKASMATLHQPDLKLIKASKNVRTQRAAVFGTSSQPPRLHNRRLKMMQHIKNIVKDQLGIDLEVAQGKIDPKSGKLRNPLETRAVQDQPYDVFTPEGVAAEKQRLAQIAEENKSRVATPQDPTMERSAIAALRRLRAKAGRAPIKRMDPKPDWRSGKLQTQPSPDAALHEIAHLVLAPPGMGLGETQEDMDRQFGDVISKIGFLKQKMTQGEIQPMALENKIRRTYGLPANKQSMNPKPISQHGRPVDQALDQPTPRFVRGITQTNNGPKSVDLIRQTRLLSPANAETFDKFIRGEIKYDAEKGWVPGTGVNAKINARARTTANEPDPAKNFARKDRDTLMRSEGMAKGEVIGIKNKKIISTDKKPAPKSLVEEQDKGWKFGTQGPEPMAKADQIRTPAPMLLKEYPAMAHYTANGKPFQIVMATHPSHDSLQGAHHRMEHELPMSLLRDSLTHYTAPDEKTADQHRRIVSAANDAISKGYDKLVLHPPVKPGALKQRGHLSVMKSETMNKHCGLPGLFAHARNLQKDDKPHPAGSPEAAAHDVVERGEPLRTEMNSLSPEKQSSMLQHLRAAKNNPNWQRSPENKAAGMKKSHMFKEKAKMHQDMAKSMDPMKQKGAHDYHMQKSAAYSAKAMECDAPTPEKMQKWGSKMEKSLAKAEQHDAMAAMSSGKAREFHMKKSEAHLAKAEARLTKAKKWPVPGLVPPSGDKSKLGKAAPAPATPPAGAPQRPPMPGKLPKIPAGPKKPTPPPMHMSEGMHKGDVVGIKDKKVISTDTKPAPKATVAAQNKPSAHDWLKQMRAQKTNEPKPSLVKHVPGVSDKKYDSCVSQVKAKGTGNPYAICTASLKKMRSAMGAPMEKADELKKDDDNDAGKANSNYIPGSAGGSTPTPPAPTTASGTGYVYGERGKKP